MPAWLNNVNEGANASIGERLRLLGNTYTEKAQFVKFFPIKTLSDSLFFFLWHFSTQNGK